MWHVVEATQEVFIKADASNCGRLFRCHSRGTTTKVGLMTTGLPCKNPPIPQDPVEFSLQML